jgi:hypothetical protein
MQKEKVEAMLTSSKRNKVQYRDEYNFRVWGICLSNQILVENELEFIYVDNLSNRVELSKVIQIKAI